MTAAATALSDAGDFASLFSAAQASPDPGRKPFGETLTGGLVRTLQLAPRQAATVTFLLTWHFPNLRMDRLPPGRHYATRFESAAAVARYVGQHFTRLSS